jgi:drug/metabolite transporter superfamily protein YnfA
VNVACSLILFAVAAPAEIDGAWLVWQGVREHRDEQARRSRLACAFGRRHT